LNTALEQLDSDNRYNSCTTVLNRNYVLEEKIDSHDADHIYNQILTMSEKLIADLKSF